VVVLTVVVACWAKTAQGITKTANVKTNGITFFMTFSFVFEIVQIIHRRLVRFITLKTAP
jgi:hypothetical protein